ncbi:hypothetical protein [Microbispora triticiradicis]|uniref:hypothetical protein n=1 Tax=Microbispora triticiradicis TaxID=2200763 RepID=UPI001AD78D6A|nr:hypothetical protein [Microbispora triticiradicis]MBO4273128.1 hypothetical protein [Microbispora triticiradicis]
MNIGLPEKLAALCRELGDPAFTELACAAGGGRLLDRLREALRDGHGPYPESELDDLNRLFAQIEGRGFYPYAQRGYGPLPGVASAAGGAQWWSCPLSRCSGHGLVRRGQAAPVCGATGDELVARPLTS